MKIPHLLIFISLLIGLTGKCFSSGCYATYLEGTRSGYGRVPLYSSGLLAASSLLLKTESDNDDKNKQTVSNAGLVASGVYFYFALHGLCKSVDRKKYDELWEKRTRLLADGKKEKDLPPELRWLLPRGSKSDLESEIKNWKRYQKVLLFVVGGLNSALLFENAQAADTDGVKYFSYLSIAAILGMAVFDVDSLWNDDPPFWANFDVVAHKVNSNIVPGVFYSYKF